MLLCHSQLHPHDFLRYKKDPSATLAKINPRVVPVEAVVDSNVVERMAQWSPLVPLSFSDSGDDGDNEDDDEEEEEQGDETEDDEVDLLAMIRNVFLPFDIICSLPVNLTLERRGG